MTTLYTILSWIGLSIVCASAFGIMCKHFDEEERERDNDLNN